MSNKSISFALVVSSGSIDRAASLAAAEAALDSHIMEYKIQQDTVSSAVSSVFDKYPGMHIRMPDVRVMVGQFLNITNNNCAKLTELALDYIRDNDGTRESGAIFGIKKGVNGGVCRWSDVREAPASSDKK